MSQPILSDPTLVMLFHGTLFFMLIYKSYELYQAYVVPWLHQKMELETRFFMHATNKKKFLITAKTKLTDQINQREQLFERLSSNTKKWAEKQHLKIRAQEQENNLINQALTHKKNQQQKQLLNIYQIKYIIPEALEQARQELDEKYASEQGKHYLFKIIEHMNPDNR